MEWIDPAKPLSSYRFEYLYVTVKLFGIPSNLRCLDLLDQILHEIGTPSDLQPMNEYMLFRDNENITARAKINVTAKAVDRMQFPVPDGQITVYVHYEKINKNLHLLCWVFSQCQ